MDEVYPYTLVLRNVDECAEFMDSLWRNRFIRKLREHQGVGISITTQELAQKLLNGYKYDETCQEHSAMVQC